MMAQANDYLYEDHVSNINIYENHGQYAHSSTDIPPIPLSPIPERPVSFSSVNSINLTDIYEMPTQKSSSEMYAELSFSVPDFRRLSLPHRTTNTSTYVRVRKGIARVGGGRI